MRSTTTSVVIDTGGGGVHDAAMELDQAARNRDLVVAGFARFSSGDVDALKDLLHVDFVEHSPGNPSGRDAFIDHIKNSDVARSELDLMRVVADDTYVVMHYRMSPRTGERSQAVVDIWRVAQGLIVEHWDVVQPEPDASDVPNGMF